MKVDLNELGEASYNELIRLKFLEDIPKRYLTKENIAKINYKLYEKMGDVLLKQIVKYDDNLKAKEIEFGFNRNGAYTQLILCLALCYANGMDLNDYFDLKVKI